MACTIIKDYICISSRHRTGEKRKGFLGVTIHETGNPAKGADAKAHSTYYNRLAKENSGNTIGYHYFVDDKEAYLKHPVDEVAYTNGDGRGNGNMKTVSVEICVNSDGDFEKARDNGAYIAALTLHQNGIKTVIDAVSDNEKHKKDGTANLFQHWNWSSYRKNCPENIRNKGLWNDFVKSVQQHLDKLNNSVPEFQTYLIKVSSPDGFLNIRKTPAFKDNDIVGKIENSNVKYTIVEEVTVDGVKFGKLKSGAGWISLNEKYVKRL